MPSARLIAVTVLLAAMVLNPGAVALAFAAGTSTTYSIGTAPWPYGIAIVQSGDSENKVWVAARTSSTGGALFGPSSSGTAFPVTGSISNSAAPYAVAVNSVGTAFIPGSQSADRRVYAIQPDGTTTAYATTHSNFSITMGETDDIVYLLQQGGQIEKLNVSTGSRQRSASIPGAWDIAFSPVNGGRIAVSTYVSNQVLVFNTSLTRLATYSLPSNPFPFAPAGIAFDTDGNIYTANSGGQNVSRIATDGTVDTAWAHTGRTNTDIVQGSDGAIYVTGRFGNVARISVEGVPFANWGAVSGQLPSIAAAPDGSIWVASDSAKKVVKVSPPAASAPGIPGNVQVTPADQSITVTWNPAYDNGSAVTEYQYSFDGSTGWTKLADPNVGQATLTGLTNGTEYDIYVRAVNGVGAGNSAAPKSATPAQSPAQPTDVSATASDTSVEVSFTAGSDGGSAITNYQYQLDAGAWTAVSPVDTTSPITIGGLTNGTTYSIKIRAVNAIGSGSESSAVVATPRGPPDAPTALTATPLDSAAEITFTPGNDGGSAITDYEYQVDAGAWQSAGATTGPITISGLDNGDTYSLKLRAVSNLGTGTASGTVSVTPRTTPAAPTALSAAPVDGGAEVSFTPGSDGGNTISNYAYRVDDGAWTAFSPAQTTSPLTISGLTNGTTYSIKIRAVNNAGQGAESASVSVTPESAPSAPTGLSATPQDEGASISFTPGSDGGSAITNYEYQLDGGDWEPAGTTSSPVVITGLTNGTRYSVKIRGVNGIGDGKGAASSAVNVTPVSSADPPGVPTAVELVPGDATLSVSWEAPSQGGAPITDYEYSTDGTTWITCSSTSTSATILNDSSGTPLVNGQEYTVRIRAKNTNGPGPGSTGTSQTPGIPLAPSDATSTWDETDLNLQWNPGPDNGDPVAEYQIVVSQLSQRSGFRMLRSGPGTYTTTSTSLTLTGLNPVPTYTIMLSARNGRGWGIPTSFTVAGTGQVEEDSQTPPSIIQQVGLPPSGVCEDVVDGMFGTQTYVRGGWTRSWATWMSNGLGGAVCTRMLVYSNAQERWVLAE